MDVGRLAICAGVAPRDAGALLGKKDVIMRRTGLPRTLTILCSCLTPLTVTCRTSVTHASRVKSISVTGVRLPPNAVVANAVVPEGAMTNCVVCVCIFEHFISSQESGKEGRISWLFYDLVESRCHTAFYENALLKSNNNQKTDRHDNAQRK